jgi:hypothetical protein
MSPLHMQGAPDEPFDPCSRVLRDTCPPILAFRFSLISLRLKQMLMADQIGTVVFGVHCCSGVARVPGYACCVLRLPAFLYVLWCSRCGIAVVKVFARFLSINRVVHFLPNQ